jgi:hypothetical protein
LACKCRWLVLCGRPLATELERPSRSFGSDFLFGDVDRAVVVLDVAVVLVSSGGALDLVVC